MRICFDPEHEIPKLQAWFAENNHPSRLQVEEYVETLNGLESRKGKKPLDINNVIYWFKNTRAAVKRAQMKNERHLVEPFYFQKLPHIYEGADRSVGAFLNLYYSTNFRSFPDWFHNLRSYIPPSPSLDGDILHQNCDCFRVSSGSVCPLPLKLHSQCSMKNKSSQTFDCQLSLKTRHDRNLSLQGFPEDTKIGNNFESLSKDDAEPSSPILSLNEVSSSRQDPPDQRESRSPSPTSSGQSFLRERDLALPRPSEGLGCKVSPPPGPNPLVPLLFPYPSHSVVYMSQYMNPFLPPCQTANLVEKKKRNRTFIDPVTEVRERRQEKI